MFSVLNITHLRRVRKSGNAGKYFYIYIAALEQIREQPGAVFIRARKNTLLNAYRKGSKQNRRMLAK
jgi:hypothetical protein